MITKRILSAFLAAAFILLVQSCDKEDDDEARYYVKYEAAGDRSLERVTVQTEIGSESFTCHDLQFSQTFGPVAKGFEARILVGTSTTETTVSIQVCRGKEPFVLKKTGQSSARYVIDF